MTRLVRFSNNAVSQLAANLLVGGTSLSVTPGDGSKFPSLSAGQYFMATLVKSDGSTEVVKVTARSTDTFTIVRAAEPVAGASTAYSFSAGDRIEARLTAGVLGNEIDRLDAAAIIGTLNKSADYTVLEADVTSLIRVDTSGGTRTITLPQISSLTADFDIIIDKVTSDVNAVTIARQGSDTINGGTLYTLTAQYQSAWVVADRATNTWSVIQSNSNGVGVNAIVDEGTGSGASTITLSVDPGSINNVDVVIGGVPQLTSSMSLSGTTLTVGGAIASGVKWMAKYCVPLSIGVPADGSVSTAKLANSAVTTAKIADANVTTAKIADANVTTAKIADANVTAAKLSTGAAVGNLGYTPLNKAGDTVQSGAWLDYQTSAGTTLKGIRAIRYGYSSAYSALQIGSPANNQNLALNVDVSAISGGSFSGIGKDIVVPNAVSFMMPNSGNTDFLKPFGVDSSGNFQFNSGYGSAGVAYGCRAWVNFVGSNGSIRSSGNVSSVTRNGTGDYTVNFTTAMPDVNYGFAGNSDFQSGTRTMTLCLDAATGQSTGSIRIKTFDGFAIKDGNTVTLSIFR